MDLWGAIISTGVVCTFYCTVVRNKICSIGFVKCNKLYIFVKCFSQNLCSLSSWVLMYSRHNIFLCSTLFQGGLKAVVWTDVFQVLLVLIHQICGFNWPVKSGITMHVSFRFVVSNDSTDRQPVHSKKLPSTTHQPRLIQNTCYKCADTTRMDPDAELVQCSELYTTRHTSHRRRQWSKPGIGLSTGKKPKSKEQARSRK